MSSDTNQEDDGEETSKLGVLVPEDVQQDNRSLVLYRNDGSKRNKLGPETTDRITHGLAMYFWRHPSKLEKVACSEYVDDPEAFKQRIKKYQDKHLEDTLVVARNLLYGSLPNESYHAEDSLSDLHDEIKDQSSEIGMGYMDQNRLDGVPRVEDAPQDGTVSQQDRNRAREELEADLKQLVQKEIRDHMEVVERRLDERLSEVENAEDGTGDK